MNSVVAELGSEKIDIIKYSEDPTAFVAASLSPADVLSVTVLDGTKSCRVVVPDDQLSLAIGKEGQNARLAAKLTGYKIDIKSESSAHEWAEEDARAAEEAAQAAAEDDFDDFDDEPFDDEAPAEETAEEVPAEDVPAEAADEGPAED